MDMKRWRDFLDNDLNDNQKVVESIKSKNLVAENTEDPSLDENTESLTEAMNADQVAAKTRSYLLKISDDIIAVTALLDQNESDEVKEKLIAALPKWEPKNSDFADAFMALDTIGAQKVAKYYRELARNLK